MIRTGNEKIGIAALSLAISMEKRRIVFYGEGQRGIFRSQFTGKVYGEADISSIWGIGPNTQYYQWRMRGNK